MAFNMGGFGLGFSQGFNNGVRIGESFRKIQKEDQIKQVAAQGLAEAEAARAAEVNSQIQETSTEAPQAKAASEVTAPSAAEASAPAASTTPGSTAGTTPAATGSTTPSAEASTVTADPTKAGGEVTPVIDSKVSDVRPSAAAKIAADGASPANPAAGGISMPFMVGGKGYATREEAQKAAENGVPPVQSFLAKTYYPKLMQAYMQQGNVEAAEKVRGLMESERGREATAQFAKGFNMLTMGDADGGIKELGKFYNEYVNDGVTWTGGSVNPDGSLTIKLKGGGGKEAETQLSRGQLARMAMAFNPAKLIEQNMLDIAVAEKSAAEAAKDNRKFNREIAKEDRKHEQTIERDTIKAEQEAAKPGETGKKLRDLEKSGIFSKDEIKAIVRASSADVGKAPHPDTIRKEVYNKLAASPYQRVKVVGADGKERMASFGSLSEEEKRGVIEREASIIQRVSGGSTPAPSSNQAAGGGITPQSAGGGKTPYWDGSKMVYR